MCNFRSHSSQGGLPGKGPVREGQESLSMIEYMPNLSEEQQAAADLVLAPLKCLDANDDTSAAPKRQKTWRLPCHSLVLSIHSKAFSASQRNSRTTLTEKTEDGKRILKRSN